MSLKDKVYFLGLGCAGGKLHKEFICRGYKGAVANGSRQDLKALGDVPTKYVLDGFDGFGGHRDKAVDCLMDNRQFLEKVNSIEEKVIFLLFGGGGSTGSGCGVVLAEMLSANPDKIICPVIALPAANESFIKHSNAYHAVEELQGIENLGATFFINNDISESYTWINSTFAKLLDAFLSNDSYGELNNFDETERLEMLSDFGAMILGISTKKPDKSVFMSKLTLDGIFAPVEEDKICENIAVIHSGKDNTDLSSESIVAAVGKPRNIFEGYNARYTLAAISGLSYPVTHVSKLGELASAAYEERQRSKKNSNSVRLGSLNFDDEKPEKVIVPKSKKPSMFELLRQKQEAISKS